MPITAGTASTAAAVVSQRSRQLRSMTRLLPSRSRLRNRRAIVQGIRCRKILGDRVGPFTVQIQAGVRLRTFGGAHSPDSANAW